MGTCITSQKEAQISHYFYDCFTLSVTLYGSQIKIQININSKNALGESLRLLRLIIHCFLMHILLDTSEKQTKKNMV